MYEAPLGSGKVFIVFECYTRAPFQLVGLIVTYHFDQEEVLRQRSISNVGLKTSNTPNKYVGFSIGVRYRPEAIDENSKLVNAH